MSRSQLNNLLVGITLIAAGVLYLLNNMDLVPEPSPQNWILIFVGASAYFCVCYFLAGTHNWGWLFPAFICAGVAGTIWMGENTNLGGLIAAPVLAGVGLPFLGIYLLDRKHWWALIPFYVLMAVVGIVVFAERVPGEVIGAYVLWSIALPFLVVYLINKSRKWALIPASILAVIGFIPLMTIVFEGDTMGSMVLLVIALPFFVVYFMSGKSWWALIPAGILASIGLSVYLMNAVENQAQKESMISTVTYIGWGITFGILWLRRKSQPTGWTVYPAVGFLIAGVLAFFTKSDFSQYWPFLIILLGLYILVRGIIGRK